MVTRDDRRKAAAEAIRLHAARDEEVTSESLADAALDAADRVGIPVPAPDAVEALRDLDERCEKAEATLTSSSAAANGEPRLEWKRQGVSLVRDYIRESIKRASDDFGAAGVVDPQTEQLAVEAGAKVLQRRWAAIAHCCHFSELDAETRAFWEPVLSGWAKDVLAAARGAADA